jgi:hypothetical protein
MQTFKSALRRFPNGQSRLNFRQYSTSPYAAPPGPIPLGDKDQQQEMQDLIKRGGLSNDELDLVAKGQGEHLIHPDAPKQPVQSFPNDVNPETVSMN